MTNLPAPRKIKPNPDCPDCLGSGIEEVYREFTTSERITCLCVLDQLDIDGEPFVIDVEDE